MNDELRNYLKRTYSYTPQPYSPNLRSIAKLIAARENDAVCIEALKEFLALCKVPVQEGK